MDLIFYKEISSLVRSNPKHNILIIGGDMNAQIGKDKIKFCLHNLWKRNGETSDRIFTWKWTNMPNTKFQEKNENYGPMQTMLKHREIRNGLIMLWTGETFFTVHWSQNCHSKDIWTYIGIRRKEHKHADWSLHNRRDIATYDNTKKKKKTFKISNAFITNDEYENWVNAYME